MTPSPWVPFAGPKCRTIPAARLRCRATPSPTKSDQKESSETDAHSFRRGHPHLHAAHAQHDLSDAGGPIRLPATPVLWRARRGHHGLPAHLCGPQRMLYKPARGRDAHLLAGRPAPGVPLPGQRRPAQPRVRHARRRGHIRVRPALCAPRNPRGQVRPARLARRLRRRRGRRGADPVGDPCRCALRRRGRVALRRAARARHHHARRDRAQHGRAARGRREAANRLPRFRPRRLRCHDLQRPALHGAKARPPRSAPGIVQRRTSTTRS